MVFDTNLLQEKLIEAWKLRSDETSFSASLSPLIGECQSDEEFRTQFTKQILVHLDSATSSHLLQSYFKFHTRSGYIHESLVIERLLSLTPSCSFVADDTPIKFLLELLSDTLKTLHVTGEQASRLGKQINLLAKWLCSALCIYSTDELQSRGEEMLILVSNLFLLLFTNTTYHCLWLMTIKAQRDQPDWRHLQEQLGQVAREDSLRPEAYEQVLSKITRLHLSDDFHQEEIEFNPSIFNPIVSMLVINQLHKSSSILLRLVRFFEHVSTMVNPSIVYLRLLQASFGGYIASIATNNSEYQQRWSAYLFFQLPRLLASCFESQIDQVKQAMENFLLHNEYLLNRMDELCLENVLEHVLQSTLNYIQPEIREQHQQKITQLLQFIQKIRGPYVQQIQHHYQNQQTHSYSYQVLHSQRSLEESLQKIFSNPDENLQLLIENFTDFIPLICALDQYYPLIRLLLSYTRTHFNLALYLLCYITSITDDRSEDFGALEFADEKTTLIYVWFKKYWLSRYVGHALFASSLDSVDLLSTLQQPSTEKEELLQDIQTVTTEQMPIKYSEMEYLSRTIRVLGELSSLSLEATKETVQNLINHLTQVSYGSLIHVLLWLIANYQIANDNERLWIQSTIHTMGATTDGESTISSLLDAIKRQLWSDFIDNPLLPFQTLVSPSSTVNNLTGSLSQSATSLTLALSEQYVINEFFNCEQSRALYICSKYVPMDLVLTRLYINMNNSNGIYETRRALYFIFGLILFRRRSATHCLLQQILPYLVNIKSNEFMLEPNVYSMCLLMNILLVLEFNSSDEQLGELFRVKPWKHLSSEDRTRDHLPKYEDNSVIDAYQQFFDWASNELFTSDNVRPVNYFLGWLQTVLWMFSRTAKVLKPFIKPKLIAQFSEYLPLQFPIEKVLSILDLSNPVELEYASMVITRDFIRLQTPNIRSGSKLRYPQPAIPSDSQSTTTPVNLTKHINAIPANL